MKKFTSIFLMVSLLCLSFASCKKDDSKKVDEEEDIKSTKMSWKIDGIEKTSTHLFAVKSEGELGIYGTINDSELMFIGINNFHGTGEYPVVEDEVEFAYTNGANPQTNVFGSTSGLVTVTSSNSNEVKGTFSGTIRNSANSTKVISEGKFEARIVDDNQ